MRYPNALRGVKTLRAAAILSVCAIVLTGILAMLGLIDPYGRFGELFLLALPILSLLSVALLVVRLVGISQAARDQSKFADARTVILIGIVVSVLGGLAFKSDSLPYALLGLLGSVLSLWASILVIQGILAFAELYRYEELRQAGNRLIRVTLIAECLAMAADLLRALLPESLGLNLFLSVFTIIALALRIWEFVLYLRYLKDAAEMLTIGNPALGRPGGAAPSQPAHPGQQTPGN